MKKSLCAFAMYTVMVFSIAASDENIDYKDDTNLYAGTVRRNGGNNRCNRDGDPIHRPNGQKKTGRNSKGSLKRSVKQHNSKYYKG